MTDKKFLSSLEAEILLAVTNHILKKMVKELEFPKAQSTLKGNCKKAFEGYITSIKEDIEYVKKAKDIVNKDSDLKLLETEILHAEMIFTYIQHYYYLSEKKKELVKND